MTSLTFSCSPEARCRVRAIEGAADCSLATRLLCEGAGPGSPAFVAAVAPIGTAATPAVAKTAIAAIVVFLFNSTLLSDRAVGWAALVGRTEPRPRQVHTAGPVGSDVGEDSQTVAAGGQQDKP